MKQHHERGGILLEVILALIIVTAAIGMLGGELIGGLKLVQYGDQQTRASELSERMLALLELDQDLVQRIFVDQEQEGDFGDQYPGYFWRIQLEPTEIEGLGQVVLEVLHNDDLDNPDNRGKAKVVTTYAMLKADPGRINLEEDFGISGPQLEQLNEFLPSLGLDPNALDPQALASLDPMTLLALLPQILPLIQQLTGGQITGSGPGGELTIEDLMNMRDQLAGGEGIPGLPGMPGGGADGGDGVPQQGSGPDGEWTLEDLLDLQEQLTGQRGPTGPGAGTGGRGDSPGFNDLNGGNRGGGGPRGGTGDGGPRGGGTPPPGAGGARGGGQQGGGNPNAGGGDRPIIEPSGVDADGNPEYTIEDLLRLREELIKRGEGG
ncbi:MAG: hypothetical protein AB7O26_15370 [Planctomycetaceae bacterium]